MFVLIRTHGKDQVNAVQELLKDLHEIFDCEGEPIDWYDVSEYAAAFLFDADAIGVTATVNEFRERYGPHFGDLSAVDHGKWVKTDTSSVGCFVFHKGTDDETGTLEDHLAPMTRAEWPDRYAKAHDFIHDNRNDSDRVSRSCASQLKAVITAAGQFRAPGDGLTHVIGRDGLSSTAFEESSLCKELVDFLKATPWVRR